MNLETPVDADDPSRLTDWLELTALLSPERLARLDFVADALGIGADTELDDFGYQDEKLEELANDLSEEIKRRSKILKDNVYPFRLSTNGESLALDEVKNYGQFAYVISLVIHHSWSDGKLLPPLKLNDKELRSGRTIFEVLAVVAAIGMTKGPGFLLGTNRSGAQCLLKRIKHICEVAREGKARISLHTSAPAKANDDKIDLIAIEREIDGPPARRFLFGQSAAGANYKDKSIRIEISRFLEIWFDECPSNTEAAMFVPAILGEQELGYHTPCLGHMLHRLRLPSYAQKGADLLSNDATLLHYVDDVKVPIAWLNAYLARARGGEANEA